MHNRRIVTSWSDVLRAGLPGDIALNVDVIDAHTEQPKDYVSHDADTLRVAGSTASGLPAFEILYTGILCAPECVGFSAENHQDTHPYKGLISIASGNLLHFLSDRAGFTRMRFDAAEMGSFMWAPCATLDAKAKERAALVAVMQGRLALVADQLTTDQHDLAAGRIASVMTDDDALQALATMPMIVRAVDPDNVKLNELAAGRGDPDVPLWHYLLYKQGWSGHVAIADPAMQQRLQARSARYIAHNAGLACKY